MKLSIIIPAYNEEQSIARIIERTLSAAPDIIKNTGIDGVEVIVVNDGSGDKTEDIARRYSGSITLISYEKNKGYGAAIKQGFDRAGGELVSFLDADGTCDPRLFSGLVNSLLKDNADITIGSRLGPGSKMPKLRRLGNIFYAKMINFFAGTRITDCSSGMRVLRKTALARLYPLPDGLHFTPAMTCRALMGGGLKITEVPIEYAERTGKSKLNVIKDGLRFLKTILGSALSYRPVKFFMTLAFGVWMAIWVVFTAREIFVKDNLRDYKALAHRSFEGRKAYVVGDKLYEFLTFCNSRLPEGAAYMWPETNREDLDRRRATYYLYPHLETDNAEFILVYGEPDTQRAGYGVFAALDKSRYILKKKD